MSIPQSYQRAQNHQRVNNSVPAHLRDTVGNDEWLRANEAAIRAALPSEWTTLVDSNPLVIAIRLKQLGIDWRSLQEFGTIMVWFEKLGILERQNGYQVRGNPSSIFT